MEAAECLEVTTDEIRRCMAERSIPCMLLEFIPALLTGRFDEGGEVFGNVLDDLVECHSYTRLCRLDQATACPAQPYLEYLISVFANQRP